MPKFLPLSFSLLFFLINIAPTFGQWKIKRKLGDYPERSVENRFGFGIIIGPTLTQIDGDRYQGFDKIGIRGGIMGSYFLDKRTDLMVGVLYNRKGSRFEDDPARRRPVSKIRFMKFNIIEFPIMISHQPRQRSDYDERTIAFYRIRAGLSYGRMIDFEIIEPLNVPQKVQYSDLADQLNKNEINLITEVNFFFNRHFGTGLQFTLQLNQVYRNKTYFANRRTYASVYDQEENDIHYLRNYQIGVQLVYKLL